MTTRVLVTGATGDTGRAAARESVALGLDVRAMVHRKDARSEALQQLGAEIIVGDLLDVNTVLAAMKGIDAAYFVWPVLPGLIHATVNFAQAAKEAGLPLTGTYSASKAAFLSLTRSIRAELMAQGTIVVGVLAVQTETAIGARLPPPRMTPGEVTSDALDAIQAGRNEEVVAGPLTQGAYKAFTADPKAFQAKMSMRLPQPV